MKAFIAKSIVRASSRFWMFASSPLPAARGQGGVVKLMSGVRAAGSGGVEIDEPEVPVSAKYGTVKR
jgi:hypothetical protein